MMNRLIVVECGNIECDVLLFRAVRNEPAADYCPRCGKLGEEVMPEVLDVLNPAKMKEQ